MDWSSGVDVDREKLLRGYAGWMGTGFPCARRRVHASGLLRSYAVKAKRVNVTTGLTSTFLSTASES